MNNPRHFCPNANRLPGLNVRSCCDVCVPLCAICGARKPTARLTKPDAFLKSEAVTPWTIWRHLVWVVPLVSLVLGISLLAWIALMAWAVKIADAWGWLP